MNIINWLDRLLIRFANHRAGKIPRRWTAFGYDGGIWDLGIRTQRQAENMVTLNGKNKIKMVDSDGGFIFYE